MSLKSSLKNKNLFFNITIVACLILCFVSIWFLSQPKTIYTLNEKGKNEILETEKLSRWKEELNQKEKPSFSLEKARGNTDGDIEIVVFSDFQCSYCKFGAGVMDELISKNDRVKINFKSLPNGDLSFQEAAYFEGVAIQNTKEAWNLHDYFFLNQKNINDNPEFIQPKLKELALKNKLNLVKLQKDIESDNFKETFIKNSKEAEKFHVDATPTFFVNGIKIIGAAPVEDFEKIISFIDSQNKS